MKPVVDAGERLFKHRYPIAHKFLSWKYRKQIDKLQKKYLGGGRTGEEFKKYKSYQLLVYKKDPQQQVSRDTALGGDLREDRSSDSSA